MIEPEINKEYTILQNETKLFHTLSPKRQDTETYEEYKFRQKVTKSSMKRYLKGKI